MIDPLQPKQPSGINQSKTLPKLATRLVEWALPPHLVEPVIGDLSEVFVKLTQTGRRNAHLWYWQQCLKTTGYFMWKTKKGTAMFLISIFACLIVMLMAMWLGGDFGMFINIPSAIIAFAPAVLFAIGSTSIEAFKSAFANLFSEQTELTNQQYTISKQVFAVLGNSAMLMGLFGGLVGFISMASYLVPANFANMVGPSFAVSILTPLYAVVFKIICYVAEQKLFYKYQLSVPN